MEELQTLSGHVGRVWNACWNPEGTILASCGEDKTIRLWVKENDSPFKLGLKTILTDGHQRTIRSVSWSPCGKYLASASFDATVAIWDKKSGEFECNVTLEGHENEVKSIQWSKSGRYLASCSRDKSIWIWEVLDDDEYACGAVINAHSQDVKKVRWHPTLDIVASASYDNTMKVLKPDAFDDDWSCCETLRSHESTVWGISFDSTGKRLASCSDDKTVKIWAEFDVNGEFGFSSGDADNQSTWKCTCTISGYHSRSIYDVDWCHQTGLIVTGCGDNGIRVFEETSSAAEIAAPTFQMVASSTTAHSQDVNCVTWNPTHSGIFASCSDDGEMKIWQVHERE